MNNNTPLHIFDQKGKAVKNAWPQYEYRPAQKKMAQSVLQCLQDKDTLVVEAGTGLGKTLAYLLPLLWIAQKTKTRVVVSTETKSLQKQILDKDLPIAQSFLEKKLRVELCMGASNFVCKRRLKDTLETGSVDASFAAGAKLENFLEWERKSPTGIRHEYHAPLPSSFWNKIHRDPADCLGRRCPHYDVSPYFVARRLWQKANVLIVNHSLLANHFALGGGLLPEFQYLVVDEAHRFPEILQHTFSLQGNIQELDSLLKESGTNKENEEKVIEHTEMLSKELQKLLADPFKKHQRITGELPLAGAFHVINALEKLTKDWEEKITLLHSQKELEFGQEQSLEIHIKELQIQARLEQIAKYRQLLEKLAAVKEKNEVVWVEKKVKEGTSQNIKDISIFCTPLAGGTFIQEKILSQVSSVIFTSATLSTDSQNTFTYFKKELGFPNESSASSIKIDSPFDYKKQALLYLPRHAADPVHAEKQFHTDISNEIHALLQLSGGGAFVLFTSARSLKIIQAVLEGRSEFKKGRKYKIFSQISMGSNAALHAFEKNSNKNNGVLLGLSTFWQGIDIPGDQLRMVILTRIPFRVPDEPVLAARIEAETQRGGNPFLSLQMPTAILSLRQGFGRLIRSYEDRGVVAILDPRLQNRFYGQEILKTLPPAPIHRHFAGLSAAYKKLLAR